MASHRRRSLEVLAARLDAFERLMDERWECDRETLKMRDDALVLQAKEYERRLDHLNHTQAAADRRNANYLPREIYESEVGGIKKLIYIGAGVIIAIQAALALWWVVDSIIS